MTDSLKNMSDRGLCQKWQQGDENAATELFQRYTDRLLDVLSRNLADRFLRRIDPESVMLSAFHSLLRRTRDKPFVFAEDAAVWKTLVTVGLNKLRNRVRDARAGRNDIEREVYVDTAFDQSAAEFLLTIPGEQEAIVFVDILETLLSRLSAADQEILRLRLEGFTPLEISEKLTTRLTSRSVNRRLAGPIAETALSLLREIPPSPENELA